VDGPFGLLVAPVAHGDIMTRSIALEIINAQPDARIIVGCRNSRDGHMTQIWLDDVVSGSGVMHAFKEDADEGPIDIVIRQVHIGYIMSEESYTIAEGVRAPTVALIPMQIDHNIENRMARQQAQRALDMDEREELEEHRRKMRDMNRAQRRKHMARHKLGNKIKRGITL